MSLTEQTQIAPQKSSVLQHLHVIRYIIICIAQVMQFNFAMCFTV